MPWYHRCSLGRAVTFLNGLCSPPQVVDHSTKVLSPSKKLGLIHKCLIFSYYCGNQSVATCNTVQLVCSGDRQNRKDRDLLKLVQKRAMKRKRSCKTSSMRTRWKSWVCLAWRRLQEDLMAASQYSLNERWGGTVNPRRSVVIEQFQNHRITECLSLEGNLETLSYG